MSREWSDPQTVVGVVHSLIGTGQSLGLSAAPSDWLVGERSVCVCVCVHVWRVCVCLRERERGRKEIGYSNSLNAIIVQQTKAGAADSCDTFKSASSSKAVDLVNERKSLV